MLLMRKSGELLKRCFLPDSASTGDGYVWREKRLRRIFFKSCRSLCCTRMPKRPPSFRVALPGTARQHSRAQQERLSPDITAVNTQVLLSVIFDSTCRGDACF